MQIGAEGVKKWRRKGGFAADLPLQSARSWNCRLRTQLDECAPCHDDQFAAAGRSPRNPPTGASGARRPSYSDARLSRRISKIARVAGDLLSV